MERKHRRFWSGYLTFYLYVAPWIIGFLVFTVGPMIASLYFSFTEYNIITPPKPIGLANFDRMLTKDPLFWKSLQVTFTYAVFHIPLTLAVALAAAMLLNQQVRALHVFRTIFFLPAILPAVASAILWTYLFHKDFGLLNIGLGALGIQGPAWLDDSSTALWAVIIIGLWGFGYTMVIFLAGLQGVPSSLYEAAELDGAGRWMKFRHVTVPMISPVMFFNLTIGTIAAFQVFAQAFILSTFSGQTGAAGPANSLLFFALYLYNNAFRYFLMGYASSLAWILFVIILVITGLHFVLGRRWVYYGGEQ